MHNKNQGAAMVEYLIGTGVVFSALFLPVLPEAGGDGRTSAAMMLVEALRDSYAGYLWAMAIPV